MKNKRWLSKSQINTFVQCPYRWKLQYLEQIKQRPSEAMSRGSKIHSEIEGFYKNIDVNKDLNIKAKKEISPELQKFLAFEQRRIQSCKNKDGVFDMKYFNPVAQELGVGDKKLMLRGFVDAVYINPEDDGLIIIDWKTGKYRPDNMSDYRFELAMYKELLEKSGKVKGDVKYWGIYFTDADKLFFEKVSDRSIKAMYKKVDRAREGMESGNYPCKAGILCRWCGYNDICEEWKEV